MDINDILKKVDHTLLDRSAAWEDIKNVCDDAIKYNTASVCIPPTFVGRVKNYVGDKMKVCTVIGFPNGYSNTAVKVYETKDAVDSGADEIDMVINIAEVKDRNYEDILKEINAVKETCGGRILKVIIETCLLTDEEKVEMCKVVTQSNADFIKTSTGFSTGGATVQDLKLIADNIGQSLKIKAAGGINSITDAEEFIRLGAERLGTSKIVKIVKNKEGLSQEDKDCY